MHGTSSSTCLTKLSPREINHPSASLQCAIVPPPPLHPVPGFIHSTNRHPLRPCFMPACARPPLLPLHTVGAITAVHTGDLAVYTGGPGLAGSRAAGNALIVGKGLLFTVHSLREKEPLVSDSTRMHLHPRPWDESGRALTFPIPCPRVNP